MLTRVAEGVLVHESKFCQSNTVVVEGDEGVLIIDAGVLEEELSCLVSDLTELGHTVVAGFSTHPHWDHLLWHEGLGAVPRYGTATCAGLIAARLSNAEWKDAVGTMIPTEIVDHVPLDEVFGRIVSLPGETQLVPWNGPAVRVLEHQAHAAGHAALLIEERGVLVAGDMLSDVLVPMLNFMATDPVADYLAALDLFEGAVADITVAIPGHGSVGGTGETQSRINRDRAYLHALRDGRASTDSRIGPSAKPGWEWVADVHTAQLQRLAAGDDRT